jgi:hypothetical protein
MFMPHPKKARLYWILELVLSNLIAGKLAQFLDRTAGINVIESRFAFV